ncbi:hypothetical protein BP5796_04522 [Coleophoma crateriformis]|uniref:RecA family profile 1 domain-containing protein n=1 Tax=Coleophoma crateriformis TaxID=565419 RepID=A0A3D8SA81_9HELO|nr:hypothetical protein BP5796_04522 [Coleophoma crateriformis]
MTDLIVVLPGFPTQDYLRLLPSLERHQITTADLVTLEAVDIAKRAQLPILDIKRLCDRVLEALQDGLYSHGPTRQGTGNSISLTKSGQDVLNAWNTISTLDDKLDSALGGGIPTGYITEVTGESGAGKTQFLLTLLLAVQLPEPRGLSSHAIYISTESALPTTRLSQLLRSHPAILSSQPRPTLDAIHSIVTPDLESQDHILRFQVPVAIRQYGIRLIILDSVAANYRAEFERPGAQKSGANMAQRSADLVKLGNLLRDIAREHNIAIVVANQVADRFSVGGVASSPMVLRNTQSSPLAHRSGGREVHFPSSSIPGPPSSMTVSSSNSHMSLDHQQRWFTGWGDSPQHMYSQDLKTPSLGLVWTTQIACRIALIKKPVYGRGILSEEDGEHGEAVLKRWRRWMKIAFAPHTPSTGPGLEGAVEFAILGKGLLSVKEKSKEEEGDVLI